jgi:hypothetical protein
MRHRSRRAIRCPSAYFLLCNCAPPKLGTTLVAARKIPHGTMARKDWNEVGRERETAPPPLPADKRIEAGGLDDDSSSANLNVWKCLTSRRIARCHRRRPCYSNLSFPNLYATTKGTPTVGWRRPRQRRCWHARAGRGAVTRCQPGRELARPRVWCASPKWGGQGVMLSPARLASSRRLLCQLVFPVVPLKAVNCLT